MSKFNLAVTVTVTVTVTVSFTTWVKLKGQKWLVLFCLTKNANSARKRCY
jgi:hypothetical protein